MENLPTTINFDDPKILQTLQQTVAIGATPAELAMFAGYCRATGLDPFKRDIWFIKASGRVQIMTGIQGFYAIANACSAYDGTETGLIGPGGEYLELTYSGNDYIGAWSKTWRKDRRFPAVGVAMLAEFDRGHGNWKTMRRVMITKCADAHSLRKAFPQQLGGLYAEEEMPDKFEQLNAVAATTPQQAFNEVATPKERKPSQTEAQIKTLALIATKEAVKYDREKVGAALKSLTEKERKTLWNGLMKDFGAVNDGSFIFTSKPVPEWEKFIAADGKGQQVELDDAAFHAEVDAALRGAS